jgi:2-polyprenyl-3-methyl-5-hydroxy-6-metoxy-1,4-benzoquinol methylase
MDDPGSDLHILEETLRQFALVNLLFTRIRYLLRRHILREIYKRPDRTYHVADLGAGACETAAWLILHAARKGLRVEVTAYDHDPRVVVYARRRYGHVAGLRIVEASVLDIDFTPAPDFVFASHLLHHLDDSQCELLLARLSSLPTSAIILSDLRRSAVAYAGYAILSLPFRNSFAREDGLISIRKGFRMAELQAMVDRATANPAAWRLRRLFPSRVVLTRNAPSVP